MASKFMYNTQGEYVSLEPLKIQQSLKEEFGILIDGSRICPPHYHEYYESESMRQTDKVVCCPEFTRYDANMRQCRSDALVLANIW